MALRFVWQHSQLSKYITLQQHQTLFQPHQTQQVWNYSYETNGGGVFNADKGYHRSKKKHSAVNGFMTKWTELKKVNPMEDYGVLAPLKPSLASHTYSSHFSKKSRILSYSKRFPLDINPIWPIIATQQCFVSPTGWKSIQRQFILCSLVMTSIEKNKHGWPIISIHQSLES